MSTCQERLGFAPRNCPGGTEPCEVCEPWIDRPAPTRPNNVVRLHAPDHVWVRKPNGERVRITVAGNLPNDGGAA